VDKVQHWENVYQTKSPLEVSWYEPDPQQSVELILTAAGSSRGRVIDIGGGQSFLVDRRRYLDLLKRTLPIGGHFVVGTFAIGGPEKCSGLPIQQYDAATMEEALGQSFEPVKCSSYEHTTPSGKPQLFFFGVFRRVM